MKKFIAIVILALPLLSRAAVIMGYVYDISSNSPVPYCNVVLKEILKGDLTDENGFFSIEDIKPGEYTLVVNIIGYEADSSSLKITNNDERIRRNVYLKIKNIEVEGIEVTADRSDFKHEISISKKTYKRADLEIPVALGEVDIMRSFQLLPSVVAASDFSSALYVRGGAPDQNLILLDNVPVFNPFHLGGIFSTFEINSIEDASFYAGGFNASYGNRLSSIIDIKTINPGAEGLKIKADVSLISSKLFIETPEYRGVSAFISGRRTYFDQLLKLVKYDFPYYFYDITGGIRVKINDKSYLKFTSFYDRDMLNLNIEDTIQLVDLAWGNKTAGLEYSFIPDASASIDACVYYSDYKNTMNFLDFMKIHSYVFQYGASVRAEKKSGQGRFAAGIELYRDSFDYLISLSDTDDLLNVKNNPYYGAVFADYTFREEGMYIISAGARLEKYEYMDDLFVSPRASLKYFLAENTSLTASYGEYAQFLTSIKQESGDFSSVFGEMWLPVPENFGPQHCKQMIIGLEQWLGQDVSLSLEAYQKNYDNLVYSTMMDIFANIEEPVNGFKQTDGQSRGFEFLLKKSGGSFQGWLGYSFASVKMLKDSVYVSPYYDKTHSLTLNLSFPLVFGIGTSVVLNYGTGMPYTAVIGKYASYSYDPLTGEYRSSGWSEINSDFNAARFPAYKRVDVGFNRKFSVMNVKCALNLNIINVFNFKNVYFYYYDHSTSPSTRHEFTMLPIIPSIGASIEF